MELKLKFVLSTVRDSCIASISILLSWQYLSSVNLLRSEIPSLLIEQKLIATSDELFPLSFLVLLIAILISLFDFL